MPVIEQVTLSHVQLVNISERMHQLVNMSQGTLEWALFRATSDELGVDLFERRSDECSCGDKKNPGASMCPGCSKYSE